MRFATRLWMFVVVAAVLGQARFTAASYGIYIGKNRTADGCNYLAGYGDEPSSHWLQVVPRRTHSSRATILVGATEDARYPGKRTRIPQVKETVRYITMNYSAFAGFPAPLTNGGLNEHGVAARDIWSPSRDELRRMTPNPQRGAHYSDLARIVLERARTAREAVEIVGSLIDRYGFTTYGGNSHLFADAEEGWILLNFAGGKGLWVAERLDSNAIRVSRPGYIGEIPKDYRENPNYRGSKNLISFAVEKGWYDPESGPFNVNRVYGDGKMRHPAVEMMEKRLAGLSGRITLKHVMAAVRTPELTRDSAGYGQVAALRPRKHKELGLLWVAASSPLTAPFCPYYVGVREIPPELKRHRYLTEGEASKFMDADRRGIESTAYAFRIFKRLFYLTKEHPQKFLPEVTEAITGFESQRIAEQADVEEIARTLLDAGKPEAARRYLTYYCRTEAMHSLRLGRALSDSIEARTKVLFGIRRPVKTGE